MMLPDLFYYNILTPATIKMLRAAYFQCSFTMNTKSFHIQDAFPASPNDYTELLGTYRTTGWAWLENSKENRSFYVDVYGANTAGQFL